MQFASAISCGLFVSAGITVSPAGGGSVLCCAALIATTFDLPAKALVMNTVQYNGYFGCSQCTQPGNYLTTLPLYIVYSVWADQRCHAALQVVSSLAHLTLIQSSTGWSLYLPGWFIGNTSGG